MVDTPHSNYLAHAIAAVVVLLMAVGTVFVFSASADIGREIELQRFYDYPGLRQILFFPLACIILYAAAALDYRRLAAPAGWLKSPTPYLLALAIVLLVLVLIPGLGASVNSARRWFRIAVGPFKVSFQPSELAKWAIILFIAAYCNKYGQEIRLFRKRFLPLCCLIGLVAGLIVVEDLGTAALICLLAFLILLIAGAKCWHLLLPLPFGAAAFIAVLLRSPARMHRIAAFLEPEKYSGSVAYQAQQSLVAIGSGGILGKGLGNGICKYGHLPEDTTDFIFAIIGEELGFVGNAAVIILFLVLLCLGIVVVVRCQDRFGRLLAGSITLAIGIQAALNIGVVTVVLPTKGIPLPFVSAGGTSLLLSSAAAGLLVNIARQTAADPALAELQRNLQPQTTIYEDDGILIGA